MPAPDASGSQLGPDAIRMLPAIDSLPEQGREVSSFVLILGMTQAEFADLLHSSTKTVQTRLIRSLILLAKAVGNLDPASPPDEP